MSLFFELIRIALGNHNQSVFSHNPSNKEWADIYAMANKQGIPGILFPGVLRLPNDQRPNNEIIADWITLNRKIEEGNNTQKKLADYATRIFKKHGFRSVIIKGLSLSKYYPNPELRHSSDVDIWLEGSKEDIVEYINTVKKPNNILYHHCDFNVIKEMSIEVHFTPSFFANPIINRRFQKWIKDCGNRFFPACDKIDEGYNVPDDDFNVTYLLTHLFRHLIDEELEIKPIIDYYFMLEHIKCSNTQKAEYMKTLKCFGLQNFAAGVMYVLGEVCGLKKEYMLCEPNAKYGKSLLDELFNPNTDKGCLTQGKSSGNHIRRFVKRQTNLFRFMFLYPKEILWSPYWTIKIFIMLRNNK